MNGLGPPPPRLSMLSSARWGSPFGGSILMTSAPRSASTAPAAGTKVQLATSTTRTPFNGPAMMLPDLLSLRRWVHPIGRLWGAASPARRADVLQAAVVGVIAQVGGDRQDVEVAGEVFGPVVDEDGAGGVEGQVRRQVAAVGVPAVLGEEAVDEVVQPEFLGPGPGVGVAAGAPQDDAAAVRARCSRDRAHRAAARCRSTSRSGSRRRRRPSSRRRTLSGAGAVGSSLARRSEDIIGILYSPCNTLGIGASDSGISPRSTRISRRSWPVRRGSR